MMAVQHEAIDLALAYDRLVEILDPLDDVCYRLELSVNSAKSLGFDLIVKMLPASPAKLNDDCRLSGSDVGGTIVHTIDVTPVLFKGWMYFCTFVFQFLFFPVFSNSFISLPFYLFFTFFSLLSFSFFKIKMDIILKQISLFLGT